MDSSRALAASTDFRERKELVRLAPAGKDIPYDAGGTEADRAKAQQRWRELIPPGRLPPEAETALFRILQESLNNVHRHSGSPRARASIYRGPANLTMEIQDDGHGMQEGLLKRGGQPSSTPGVGVAGMRERVRQLGGQLEIHSTESGTTLKVVLPLN